MTVACANRDRFQTDGGWTSRLRIVGTCAALGVIGIGGVSAEDGFTFSDLLVNVGALPKAKVTERATDSNTVNTTYRWDGVDHLGLSGSVGCISGIAHSWGGLVWGGDLAYSRNNITPTGYTVAGTSYAAGSVPSISYQTACFNVDVGYEYGIIDDDDISGYIEILPWFGVGEAWAQTDARLSPQSPAYAKASGHGVYYEYGIRLGGFLTERNMIYGITCGYCVSRSVVPIELSPEYHSDVTIDRTGLNIGVSVGYRF